MQDVVVVDIAERVVDGIIEQFAIGTVCRHGTGHIISIVHHIDSRCQKVVLLVVTQQLEIDGYLLVVGIQVDGSVISFVTLAFDDATLIAVTQ